MNKKIKYFLAALFKYSFIFLVLIMTLLILFIFKDAYEQKYEPRGYTSPYNKDISSCFTQIPADDFFPAIQSMITRAKTIGNVKGISFITVYFDNDNHIKSFEATFVLKNRQLFRGFMTVESNGNALQEYYYYKYSEKYKVSDCDNILMQCKSFEEMIPFQKPVQKAVITDRKISFYNNDNLVSEYNCE